VETGKIDTYFGKMNQCFPHESKIKLLKLFIRNYLFSIEIVLKNVGLSQCV
jgi:hypothetical protein